MTGQGRQGDTARGGAAAPRAAARGALLGTFVGDALGARWEGAPTADSWDEGRDRLRTSSAQPQLTYTDDTQMMLALARHMVDDPDVDVDGLARAFVDAYEPWRGYGGGTVRVLRALREGLPVAEAARAGFPDGSLGNGAAMRAAPVGVRWAFDPARRTAAARRSALPTHVHPQGVDGAVVVAGAVAHAAGEGRFAADQLADLAGRLGPDLTSPEVAAAVRDAARRAGDVDAAPGEIARALGVSATAARSVGTALWVAGTAADPPDAAARALALGGDADTIAAMALAVHTAAHGGGALPDAWLSRCEDDGPAGVSACTALADRLAA